MADAAVYLVTRPSAAGKTTVGRLLAERFARGVFLEGDAFRRCIVTGREEMTPDLSPQAIRQLRLRYRVAALAADAYCAEGFTVVVEDVVAGSLLDEYVALIESRPLHVVVLLPSLDAVRAREAAREQVGYVHFTADDLHEGFASGTTRVGLWLDTSELTPDETVEAILARTSEALV